VSGWEIAIKTRLGRLSVADDNLEDFVGEQVAANGFLVLPIHLNHALRTYSLPDYNRDPFDHCSSLRHNRRVGFGNRRPEAWRL